MTTELQSCLNELDNIVNSLMAANFYFEYSMIYNPIVTDKEFKSIKPSLHTLDPLFDILFESMVIHLYKLFEIHPILTKCIKESNHIQLLKVLKDSWSNINKHRNKITIWRNNIISHSKEQALNYLSYDTLDPNYNETRKSIVSISRCAVIYIWAIIRNFLQKYINATYIKEEFKYSLVRVDGIEVLSKAIYDEKQFWTKINEKLKNNEYKVVNFCGYQKCPTEMIE